MSVIAPNLYPHAGGLQFDVAGANLTIELTGTRTSILPSIARNRHPALFCRDLALSHLDTSSSQSAAILHPSETGGFIEACRYGFQQEETSAIAPQDLEKCLRNRANEPVAYVQCWCCLELEPHDRHAVALIPASADGGSFGVLVLRGSFELMDILDDPLLVQELAFACELYTSAVWFGGRNSLTIKADKSGEDLTPRQLQVLTLLCEGRTNSSIARKMNYSLATIKNDVTRIYRFLGAVNRRDAILKAESLGLDETSTRGGGALPSFDRHLG